MLDLTWVAHPPVRQLHYVGYAGYAAILLITASWTPRKTKHLITLQFGATCSGRTPVWVPVCVEHHSTKVYWELEV